jgi:hypothetical protein
MELNGQLQALCRNGGREHPANKPKIARIMKDIKAKKDAKTVVSGMLGKLQDQCNLITSFLQTAEANEAFKPDPLLKSQMAQLAKDIELNSDHQAELQQEYEEVVSIFSEEPFIDDEELARQLEEIHPSTSASAAQHPLPALSLPAAGSKAVPSAWGAAAPSTRGDSSEDELERYWIARLVAVAVLVVTLPFAGFVHLWHKFMTNACGHIEALLHLSHLFQTSFAAVTVSCGCVISALFAFICCRYHRKMFVRIGMSLRMDGLNFVCIELNCLLFL